jgi:hypothetical protein
MDIMLRFERAVHAAIGVADTAARPARAVTSAGARAGITAWDSLVPRRAQRSVESLMQAAERRGAQDTARLRATAGEAVDALLDSHVSRAAVRRLAASTLVQEALDEVFAGPLPEDVGQRLVTHRVLERVAGPLVTGDELEQRLAALLDDPALERIMARALDSRFAESLTDQILASDELRRIVAHIARSEDVRVALQAQSVGLADEVAGEVRERTMGVDDAMERTARRLLRRRAVANPVVEVADDLVAVPAPERGP